MTPPQQPPTPPNPSAPDPQTPALPVSQKKPTTLKNPSSQLNQDPEALACLEVLWQVALELKALNAVAFDVRSRTPLMDYVLLCSGRSSAHVRGIGEKMLSSLKEARQSCWGVEGRNTGNWLLLDCGVVLAHVFRQETRQQYDLDSLLDHNPKIKTAAEE